MKLPGHKPWKDRLTLGLRGILPGKCLHRVRHYPQLQAFDEGLEVYALRIRGERLYFTRILPMLQIFLLENFLNDSGKKYISRLLYARIPGSILGPNKDIQGVQINFPVLNHRTE